MWWFSYQKKRKLFWFPSSVFQLNHASQRESILACSLWVCHIQFSEADTLLMCFVTFPRTGNGEQYPTNHHTFHGFPSSEAVFFREAEVLVWEIRTKQKRRLCSSLICPRLVKGVVEIIALNPVWEFWFLYGGGFLSGSSSVALPCCSLLPLSVMPSSCGKCCLDGYLTKVVEVCVCVCLLRDTFLTNKPLGKSVHFYFIRSLECYSKWNEKTT